MQSFTCAVRRRANRLMPRVFDVLPAIAASPGTVLILGETGTGREPMARTVHLLSSRRDRPFVAVDCGALPDTPLESGLFGYKARRVHRGEPGQARTVRPGRGR